MQFTARLLNNSSVRVQISRWCPPCYCWNAELCFTVVKFIVYVYVCRGLGPKSVNKNIYLSILPNTHLRAHWKSETCKCTPSVDKPWILRRNTATTWLLTLVARSSAAMVLVIGWTCFMFTHNLCIIMCAKFMWCTVFDMGYTVFYIGYAVFSSPGDMNQTIARSVVPEAGV